MTPWPSSCRASSSRSASRSPSRTSRADTETQYLYLDKTIPLAIDGTAGRNSPVEMLDVLYSQKGLMNVDGKTSTTSPTVTQALNKALTVPLNSPDYRAPCRAR